SGSGGLRQAGQRGRRADGRDARRRDLRQIGHRRLAAIRPDDANHLGIGERRRKLALAQRAGLVDMLDDQRIAIVEGAVLLDRQVYRLLQCQPDGGVWPAGGEDRHQRKGLIIPAAAKTARGKEQAETEQHKQHEQRWGEMPRAARRNSHRGYAPSSRSCMSVVSNISVVGADGTSQPTISYYGTNKAATHTLLTGYS